MIVLVSGRCFAQESAKPAPASKSAGGQINVNWLYGAYVPKDVPLVPLTGRGRFQLYLRQTYTTPGIYLKTSLFALRDQVRGSPYQWGGGGEGLAKRLGSRHAQFVMQSTFSAAGHALLRWEPRYERCRGEGFWLRTRHAMVRNFVTYGRTGKELRPHLVPYAAAFGGGAIAATWHPGHPDPLVKGYQGAITQVGVGMAVNWLGEFAPEIIRIVRKNQTVASHP